MQPQTFGIVTYSRAKYSIIVIATIALTLAARYFLMPDSTHPFGWLATLVASFVLGNFLARRVATTQLQFTLTDKELLLTRDKQPGTVTGQILLSTITNYQYKAYRDFDEFELWVKDESRLKLSLDKSKESRIEFGKFYDALTAVMKTLHPQELS